jgi:hypothetical protein
MRHAAAVLWFLGWLSGTLAGWLAFCVAADSYGDTGMALAWLGLVTVLVVSLVTLPAMGYSGKYPRVCAVAMLLAGLLCFTLLSFELAHRFSLASEPLVFWLPPPLAGLLFAGVAVLIAITGSRDRAWAEGVGARAAREQSPAAWG